MPAQSDHFDGQRFFNPTGPALQPLTAVPRMLLTPRAKWPRYVPEVPRQPPPRDTARPVVTFVGHATFLIQTAAGNILTDPIYSTHAGPLNRLGPRRVRPAAIAFDFLPPISIVLLSHNHYDHCDLPTLGMLAKRFDPLVVTPLGNGRFARAAGIRRVEELDWWQSAQSSGVPITLTPAHHFSARGPFDRNRALWGGFMLTADHASIYFAGDTAYAPFFHNIRQRLGPIDLALLPIGAYEPRWFMQSVHMNPAEAVQAHLDLGASESIAMHFGTFPMTAEGIDEPVRGLGRPAAQRASPRQRFGFWVSGNQREVGIVPICVDEALYNGSLRSFINRGNRYVAADTEKTRPHRSSTQTAGGAKGLASDLVFALQRTDRSRSARRPALLGKARSMV